MNVRQTYEYRLFSVSDRLYTGCEDLFSIIYCIDSVVQGFKSRSRYFQLYRDVCNTRIRKTNST